MKRYAQVLMPLEELGRLLGLDTEHLKLEYVLVDPATKEVRMLVSGTSLPDECEGETQLPRTLPLSSIGCGAYKGHKKLHFRKHT